MAKLITPVASKELLDSLVADVRQRFHIEFRGGLSNHFTQTIGSLYKIGASDIQLKDFHKRYPVDTGFGSLEPHNPTKGQINISNWKDHIGDMSYFLDYVEFFRDQRKKFPTKDLLEEFYQDLIFGIGGSAFHGMIELGWSLSIDQPIEEGIAYSSVCYVKLEKDAEEIILKPSDISNSLPLIEVFKMIRNEKIQHNLFNTQAEPGLLNVRLGGLMNLTSGKSPSDSNFDYTNYGSKKASMWKIDASSSESIASSISELNSVCMQLFHSTGCRDFFILHMLTGSYALREIAKNLRSIHKIHLLLRSFLLASVYVYILQGCPEVKETPKSLPTDHMSWRQICEHAINNKDEHVPKVVQVCLSMCAEGVVDEALCQSVAENIVRRIEKADDYNFVGVR